MRVSSEPLVRNSAEQRDEPHAAEIGAGVETLGPAADNVRNRANGTSICTSCFTSPFSNHPKLLFIHGDTRAERHFILLDIRAQC